VKAKCCDECQHYTRTMPPCSKGHAPRFYLPRYVNDGCGWGFKRRCQDFAQNMPDSALSPNDWAKPTQRGTELSPNHDADALGRLERLVRTSMNEKSYLPGDEYFSDSQWDTGDYVEQHCSNCGRQRVRKCDNGKHRCDKCNWVIEDNGYCIEPLEKF